MMIFLRRPTLVNDFHRFLPRTFRRTNTNYYFLLIAFYCVSYKFLVSPLIIMNGGVHQEHCVHVHLCITLSRFIVRDKIQSRWNVSWFSTLPRRSTLPPHRLRTCWTATLNAEGRPWATIICHRGNPYSTLTVRHGDPQNLFLEILVLCVKITNGDLKIRSKNFHFRGCDIFNNSRYLDLSVDLHLEIPWRFIVALTLIKFCFIYRNFTRSCYFIRFIEILIPQKGNLLLLWPIF